MVFRYNKYKTNGFHQVVKAIIFCTTTFKKKVLWPEDIDIVGAGSTKTNKTKTNKTKTNKKKKTENIIFVFLRIFFFQNKFSN